MGKDRNNPGTSQNNTKKNVKTTEPDPILTQSQVEEYKSINLSLKNEINALKYENTILKSKVARLSEVLNSSASQYHI